MYDSVLTTVLTTKERFFEFFGLFFGPIIRRLIVDPQDHFLVRVAHPPDHGVDLHAGIPAHAAEAVSQIIGNNSKREY